MSATKVPIEVWLMICKHVDDEDAASLYLSRRDTFWFLGERAYSKVTLKENAASGRRVLAIAEGPRAHLVRTLRYMPTDPKPLRVLDNKRVLKGCTHDPSVTLSEQSAVALRSLGQFPNLEQVDVALEDWILDWPDLPLCFGSRWDDYHRDEDAEPWRILLAESFRSLALSRGAFPKLCINCLPPAPAYHVLKSKSWHEFLGNLQSLQLELRGADDWVGRSMTLYHQAFVQNIPDMLLNKATNLEHLRILGDNVGFIGLSDKYDNSMSWAKVDMPRLKSFELKSSYVNEQLIGFLARHLDSLEHVDLRHCVAKDFVEWREILSAVMASEKLVHFVVCGFNNAPDAVEERFPVGKTEDIFGKLWLNCWRRDYAVTQYLVDRKAEVARLWGVVQERVARNRAAAGLPAALPEIDQ